MWRRDSRSCPPNHAALAPERHGLVGLPTVHLHGARNRYRSHRRLHACSATAIQGRARDKFLRVRQGLYSVALTPLDSRKQCEEHRLIARGGAVREGEFERTTYRPGQGLRPYAVIP